MIDEGKRFYAEIKAMRGVWAAGKTLEECRANLLSALEGLTHFSTTQSPGHPRLSSIHKNEVTQGLCLNLDQFFSGFLLYA